MLTLTVYPLPAASSENHLSQLTGLTVEREHQGLTEFLLSQTLRKPRRNRAENLRTTPEISLATQNVSANKSSCPVRWLHVRHRFPVFRHPPPRSNAMKRRWTAALATVAAFGLVLTSAG